MGKGQRFWVVHGGDAKTVGSGSGGRYWGRGGEKEIDVRVLRGAGRLQGEEVQGGQGQGVYLNPPPPGPLPPPQPQLLLSML